MKKVITVIVAFLVTSTSIAQKNQNVMKPVYEIAINQAKKDSLETFLETRKKFVEVLGKEETTLNEGKWKPIFTVNPDYNLDEILIGMTEWSSFEGFGETAIKLMPQEVTQNYFSSFNPLAYAILEPLDDKNFDFESIKKEGQVIEFAIRKGKTADAFGENREAFFSSLNNYEGFKSAREFKVYELDENGMPHLAENTQAVIIVWESITSFQAAAEPVLSSELYQKFSSQIDVQSYFASVPTK